MILPFSLLEKAIEEFYLIELNRLWENLSVFVPVRPSFHSRTLWSWVSTILEMDIKPDNLHTLGSELAMTEQIFSLIIKRTELKFTYLNRNRIPIKTSREFAYRLRRIHKTLSDVYEGNTPTIISLINESLILGTDYECPLQVMSRLGISN